MRCDSMSGSETRTVVPPSHDARQVDLAAVVLDDALDDGQAEPGAALPRTLSTVELFEHTGQLGGRDPFAAIGHLDVTAAARRSRVTPSHLPSPAWVTAFSTRLSNDVQQHQVVGTNERRIRRQLQLDLDTRAR